MFDKRTQLLIALFGFLVAFPVFEIPTIGISVSFPVFLWICFRVKIYYRKQLFVISSLVDKLMLAFVAMAGISILFAPATDIGGSALVIRDFKSFLYLAYWFCVYAFFRRWYSGIQIKRLSFSILIGALCSTLVILLGARVGGSFVIGPMKISQNDYALTAVACMGAGATFLLLSRKGVYVLLYSVAMVYPMMVSDSRTGIVIMIVQGSIISFLVWSDRRMQMRRLMVGGGAGVLLLFTVIATSIEYSPIGRVLGSWIRPHSENMALLIEDPEEVNNRDKSWLIRKVQIEKGINLFLEHPISGVGWGHFKYIRGDVDVKKHKYLHKKYDSYALGRSSHNSYIQVLAETGLLGFIPLILIQLSIIILVFRSLLCSHSIAEVLPLGTSLLGMGIYFWIISAITGALWYFIIGLFAGALVKDKRGKNESRILLPHPRP